MIKIWKNEKLIGGHNNLVLELEPINFKQIADSYYFALDNGFMKGDESTEKVILNIQRLLKQWIIKAQDAKIGELVFLPFDFSDQYIGCLLINRLSEQKLSIDYGATLVYDAISFRPSDFPNEFRLDIQHFISQETNAFEIYLKDFIEKIRESIKNLGAKNNRIEWLN